MNSKMKILIFYAQYLDIPKEDGSGSLKGVTLEYLMYGDDGLYFTPKEFSQDSAIGIKRAKAFLGEEFVMNFNRTMIPGIFDGTFEFKMDKDGHPQLTLRSVEFCGPAEILFDDKNANKAN